jgi:hypothetical protein
MRYRRIALLIVVYVSLDLTNPFLGCAFNFNADESMDGVSRQHERFLHHTPTVALPMRSGGEAARLTRSAPARPFLSRALGEWFVQLRQAHAPHSDPQSPAEDH